MAEIEKSIAFFIQSQFPAIYRENGAELVELVEAYYKFLETDTKQSHYNSRRMFDYRDIDNTLESMVIFFQKKFLSDLPLKENSVRFIVKNILDLYRRKGTPAGIELFFALFYDEYEAQISYPAKYMMKLSNSNWKNGVYLQMVPNRNRFFSKSQTEYSYQDLLGRNITGSASGAKAAVDKINFVILNNILTPIIYLDEVQGTFAKYDDIISNINGEVVAFGRVAGSLNAIEIDENFKEATTGHKIGDIYNVQTETGRGGKVVVTNVTDDISGEIIYDVTDGGFGYTIDNTRLNVSNQTILFNQLDLDSRRDDLTFEPYERLRDNAGNEAIVIGQAETVLGVKCNAGQSFSISSLPISTLDRFDDNGNDINISFSAEVGLITDKNDSSPGDMYADTGDPEDVKILSLENTTNVDVITDLIAPHLATVLNIPDYEVNAPFSGSASPVNLSTALEDAFDIQTLTIGSIGEFENINPGSQYTFDVFALARDSLFSSFKRKNQVINFTNPASASLFSVGNIIEEDVSGVTGVVKQINAQKGFIIVVPYDYYGFTGNDIIRENGNVSVKGVSVDYNSPTLGENAIVETETRFAIGKISEVDVVDSGFGYVTGQDCTIFDDDDRVHAAGIITAQTQGITGGFWSDYSSHINGYQQLPITDDTPILPTDDLVDLVTQAFNGQTTAPPELGIWINSTASDGRPLFDMNANNTFDATDVEEIGNLAISERAAETETIERWNNIIAPNMKTQVWYRTYPNLYEVQNSYEYYDSGMKIQDSDFYQEYSYLIKSTLAKQEYETLLRENVHLAGTKMFGDFIFQAETGSPSSIRFRRIFNDDGVGTPLDRALIEQLTADIVNWYADSETPTADDEFIP